MRRLNGVVLLIAALGATAAAAEVGTVAALDGKAKRTPENGASELLAPGAQIQLGDTLQVDKGFLKVQLLDGSEFVLDAGSSFTIRRAEFEKLERKAFGGFLSAGSLWSRVKSAVSGGSYEVQTDRAVAGVRGTIFRIDANALIRASKSGAQSRRASVVRVTEGRVAVRPSERVGKALLARAEGSPPARAEASRPARAVAPAGPAAASAAPGAARTQVAGPQQVSEERWEALFVELQANQQVAVGEDLWETAELDAAAKKDALTKWLEAHP